MPISNKIYPRTGDTQTVYLKNVITNPNIKIGDYTMYNDFVNDPKGFEQNNVLYHYPINHDKLIIGKFCSIACGAKFLFNSANHSMSSLSTYPFLLFFEEWALDKKDVIKSWDNKGDIIVLYHWQRVSPYLQCFVYIHFKGYPFLRFDENAWNNAKTD